MAEGRVKIDVDLNGEKAKSGIRGIRSSLEGLGAAGTRVGSVFKSVLGANLVSNAIVGSIRGISNGVKGLVSELNSSSKAWQTFEGNMQMLGKSSEEIGKAKSAMQDYATKTIYSASDMAQTYSQLAAVGISETDKLVTGFGGLASAAENPQQAMKTLSTQAVQMAAKPKVAWQDFKLMLEQTPAGISAIAKEMGMTTSEMVKAVQDGTLKTEDFFNAIKKVGNNADFSKMATQFKTIDQAIDGAKESLSNKLEPAFKRFNSFGIKAVVAVTEALEKIDFNGIADKLGAFLDSIDIDSVITSVSNAIGTAIQIFQNFWPVIKTVGSVLFELGSIAISVASHIGKFLGSLSPGTVTALTYAVLGAVGAFKAFNFLKGFNPFGIFKRNAVGSIGSVTGKVKESGSVISKVFSGISKTISSVSSGISQIIRSIGTSISSIAKGIGTGISTIAQGIGTGLATAFRGLGMAIAMVPPTTWLALGAGIAIVCAGLALLATQSEGVSQILEALGNVVTTVINTAVEGMIKLIPVIVDVITTIMGAIGSFISTVVPVISTAISNIVTSITQGIATIIGAISGLLDSVSNVFDSIAAIISSVGEAISLVLDGLGNAFTGLGNGIRLALEGVGSLVESVGSAIKSALEGVGSVVESVGTAIKSVLEGLGEAFEKFGKAVNDVCDGISKVIDSVGSAIRNVLDGVAGIFDSIGEAALKAGEGFKLFAEGVKTLVDLSLTDIVSTITGLGLSLGTITGKSEELATLGGSMTSFGQGLSLVSQSATGLSGVLDGVASSINSFKSALDSIPSTLSSVVNAMSGFANGVISSLGALGQAGTMILAFNGQAMSVASTLSSVGSAVSSFSSVISSMSGVISSVSGVVGSLGSSLSSLGGVLGTVSSSVNSLIGVLNSLISSSTSVSNDFNGMANAVSSAGNSISNSMRGAQANISSACNAIVNIVRTCANQMQNEGQKAGQNCARAIADRINAGRGAVTSAMQSIKSSIEQVGNATVSSVTSIGARISQGVAQGMYSALGSVTAAANAIIYQVQRAMEAKAQIHSPARLFMNKIGKYIPMGVAKGITKFSGVVNESMGFIDNMVHGYKFSPESVLSFGKGYAPVGASTSNYNSVSNNTSNYGSLLHIENFENKGEQDIRKLFEQIKFLTREERNRL